ncbi:MAG: hypothetical protein Q9218_004984 [Villophora microphyllina]
MIASATHIIIGILVLLVRASLQVDITLACPGIGPAATSTCPDILPGVCCRAVHWQWPPDDDSTGSPAVALIRFDHLLPGDIAAVWEHIEGHPDTTPTGCSTRVHASGHGPGTYTYTKVNDPKLQAVGGGSYLKLSQLRLPPDPSTIATMIKQRIIGLAWMGGSWFMNSAMQNRFGGTGSRNNPKSRRDIRSEMKGTVYAGPPLTWVYPAYIDVNGIRYSDGGDANLIYKDDHGAILNLTTGAIVPTA